MKGKKALLKPSSERERTEKKKEFKCRGVNDMRQKPKRTNRDKVKQPLWSLVLFPAPGERR